VRKTRFLDPHVNAYEPSSSLLIMCLLNVVRTPCVRSRWQKPLECGRQSATTSPEAGLRLHSGPQILEYCIACKCFSAAGEVFRCGKPGFLTRT